MPAERPELAKRPANYVPLTPLSFLARAERIWRDRTAVIDGGRRFTYGEFAKRCRRLADALAQLGVGRGDTVAILSANAPALLEAHYAVPMLGAVLNPINIRLDAGAISACLSHGEAKLFLADRDFADAIVPALERLDRPPAVVDIASAESPDAPALAPMEYEAFLAGGDEDFAYPGPQDEWDSICLLYTSGTTGDPKGAVYSHRGAYLAALSNALTFKLDHDSVYLWTLPMFHCSGWSFTWAVTAAGGAHVCLRKVEPARVFDLIAKHKVTHLCGAPIVLNMLAHAPAADRKPLPGTVKVATGGAAPPSAVIAAMEKMGFEVTHLYGATESYGPSTYCPTQDDWASISESERHLRMARQGVPTVAVEALIVADPVTLAPVPQDGATIGEILVRANTVMKGYLKNPLTTEATLREGWYRSGDLAVWHPDGTVEIKDRAKDIIISGGENISSLEVEEVLYRHPSVMEAAVVAKPDETWGETPCAFVMLKPDAKAADADGIIAWCRDHMAHFKAPRHVVFGPLPKTSTGKIQKFVLREKAREIE